jgi:hypothetical protein
MESHSEAIPASTAILAPPAVPQAPGLKELDRILRYRLGLLQSK